MLVCVTHVSSAVTSSSEVYNKLICTNLDFSRVLFLSHRGSAIRRFTENEGRKSDAKGIDDEKRSHLLHNARRWNKQFGKSVSKEQTSYQNVRCAVAAAERCTGRFANIALISRKLYHAHLLPRLNFCPPAFKQVFH